ncbi:dynein axonemal assembly factor 3-like [Mytilus galloprovincialis]|uniref:dynein axonemal assembly factor 3-like n=1 Tax=Mytilus galloprovincialis TaxID=29158 RepID=UPI003F7C1BE7
MTDQFGTITWWGFTPALDLQDTDTISALNNLKLDTDEGKDTLNILLIGAGDIRHVLQTIARSYRHKKRKLHFYIIETQCELYCRDLLFMSLFLEPPNRMGLQEKTELFLELYGNLLVRQQSMEYVQKMSNEMIKMVTDFDYLEKKLPFIDLSQLKFKERDFMEGIFKFWRNPDPKLFDVEKMWDLRLQRDLGVRYDTRDNVFDWDYHMRLIEREGDIIHAREYKNWRKYGIAYEPRDGNYDVPNRTLASGVLVKHEGERFAKRGFWGDMLVSPYITFGIQSEDKTLFKKNNNMYAKLSWHVSEFNILSLLHEIINKEKYVPPQIEEAKEKKSATITEITEEEENEEDIKEKSESTDTASQSNPAKDEYESLPLDDVKITFLPVMSVADLSRKSKYQKLFDIIYFSNSLVHLLTSDLTPIYADAATIIAESARYMLQLKDDKVEDFFQKVKGMAEKAGCQVYEVDEPKKENYLKFTYRRQATR